MKKNAYDGIVMVAGLVALAVGLVLLKVVSAPQGIMRTLPYVCIGLGCGAFGHGMGNLLSRKAMKRDPQMARQIKIEQGDERNVAIGNRAKAKAFDMMTFVFGALMVSFALMGADLAVILLFVGAYLFVEGCAVYWRVKLGKEM